MQAAAEQEYIEYVTARLPVLRRLAYLLCGDEHHGDDLVQQTITTLYMRWPRIHKVTRLDQYVRTMLVHAFIDERRLTWSRVRLVSAPPDQPAPQAGSVEDRQMLRSAIAKLTRRQQAVLVLRFVHDLPVNEVAELMDCSVGTVKSQTSHALVALRRVLGEEALAILDGSPQTKGS
jgi:RNA polymerase sigma-70 factor (sigma-E family)